MELQIQKEKKFKFVEYGEGDTIVLLHGLFGALSNFTDLIDHFSRTHRVVIPLLPIYELPLLQTSVTGLVKYVKKFIDHKAYSKVDLLGNSLGGHVGLIYTVQYPEKVRSLILTGSSGLFEKAFGDNFPPRSNYEFIRNRTAQTFYDPDVATKELVDEVYDIVNHREKALRVLKMAKSAMRHNMRDELKNINVPVLLIWGKNDTITPDFVAKEFHERLPQSELIYIDKCGHAPMMEHPSAFNEYLERFLLQFNNKQNS